jgi:hypothetical protein
MCELFTIPALIALTFKQDRPPRERGLREKAQRLRLGTRIGRQFYISQAEWNCLLSAKEENTSTRGARSRCVKRTVPLRGSELKNQLTKQAELERYGLLKPSLTTTTNKPTGPSPRQSHSPTRP